MDVLRHYSTPFCCDMRDGSLAQGGEWLVCTSGHRNR